MAVSTLVATAGDSGANSYVTVAEADQYFADRLQATAWTGEDTDDKTRALFMATLRLDAEEFAGEKNASGQALKWPRGGAVDDDGEEYDNTTIPEIVKDACCELALVYLTEDDEGCVPFTDTGLEEYTKAQIGSMNVERDQSFKAGQLPAHVRRILRTVLVASGSVVALERA